MPTSTCDCRDDRYCDECMADAIERQERIDHGGQLGTVYILHIEPPYKHARHYVGWVKARDEDAVSRRLRRHIQGHGARLLKVAVDAGCRIYIGQRFSGKTRAYERMLKDRRGGHPLEHYCVVCKAMRRTM